MTSYKGLLNKIEAFCNAHLQIKKYGGEFKEQMPNFSTENEKYPIVYVVPTSDISDLNTNQFTLDIYCVDIIQKDRANINTIISDCNLILNDLYLYFLDGNDLTIDVIGASNGSPLNNFDLDYSAGWVKSITFEVGAYSVCAIPMNPISPNPPLVCDNAVQIIEDIEGNELYNNSIPSGATETQVIQDSTAVLKDTLGATISTTSILAEASEDITAPNSTYLVEYVNGTDIQSGSIVSGGSVTVQVPNPVTCEDATVNVNGAFWDSVPSGGTENVIVRQSSGSTQVGSIQGQYFRIADSTAVLKTTGGTTISTTSIKAEDSENIVAPNTTIEVNGTTEGTVVAGATVDIQLSNPSGTVTPTSVTQVGNDLQVVLPASASPTYATARLLKTGQTISYRTGDDGDFEEGRATNFLTLLANNPFGNTNRFTSELGTQTYTNNIAIDWSTYDGVSVLGYYILILSDNVSWNTAIDLSLTKTIGGFSSWRMCNNNELGNLVNFGVTASTILNYAPFNITTNVNVWCSTTSRLNTANAFILGTASGSYSEASKAINGPRYMICRTFTVTGTTLS
jgi:hypothetical protein